MSNLYANNYISHYNNQEMYDILEGRINYVPNPNDLGDKQRYVTLQHFLIMYMEKHGKTPIVNKLLRKYIDDFAAKPSLFADSPLLRNGFIDRYMPEGLRQKMKNYRDGYYSKEKNQKLYEIAMRNNELSDKQKDQLYSYLILQMKNNNTKLSKVYENCAKKILNSNKLVSELNDMELKFYCTYISQLTGIGGDRYKTFVDIHIMEREPNLGGFQNSGIVYINKNSKLTRRIEDLTQTVCHETRHTMQEIESRHYTGKMAIEMAKMQLFCKYLGSKEFDIYHKNYRYEGIELDAENYGYFYAKTFLGMLGRRDLAENLNEVKKERYNKRDYYGVGLHIDKQVYNLDQFIVDGMDKIMREHPEEIKNYKALEEIYNPDGTRKRLGQLMAINEKQPLGEKTCTNYINYEIARGALDNVDVSKATLGQRRNFFKALSNTYRDSAIKLKDYFDDNESYKDKLLKVTDNQVEKTVLYQLQILENMAEYIDKNMKYVLECKEEKNINNKSFIYNFIYDLRDFEASSIKNEIVKNSPLIRERIDKLMEKHQSIVKKYNEQYIKDRTANITQEQLNTVIKTPDGIEEPYRDYLYYDLLPRLDGHSEVEIQGKKVYVGKILEVYNNMLAQVNVNDSNYQM